jgi:hypothetical protein
VVSASLFLSQSGRNGTFLGDFGSKVSSAKRNQSAVDMLALFHASFTTSPVPTCLIDRTIHTTRRASASVDSDERGFS